MSTSIDVCELILSYWFTIVPAATHILVIHHPIRAIDQFGLILTRVLFWNTEIDCAF